MFYTKCYRVRLQCDGDAGGKKGQGGIGLVVRKSISRAEVRSTNFVSDRLLKITLTRCWICTNRHSSRWEDNTFWTFLDWLVKGVLEHEQQLFVLMDANARTGRKGGGRLVSVERKVLGAYGRDTLNGNGDRLLSITNNHGLALLKSFFSTAKKAISHYVRRRGKQKNDYIFTRQRGRNVVQDITVHLQLPFLPISDHNIHRQSIYVKLLGRFTRNRLVKRARRPPPVSIADG